MTNFDEQFVKNCLIRKKSDELTRQFDISAVELAIRHILGEHPHALDVADLARLRVHLQDVDGIVVAAHVCVLIRGVRILPCLRDRPVVNERTHLGVVLVEAQASPSAGPGPGRP